MAAQESAPQTGRHWLGVDPGLAATGYAVLKGERVLDWGCWRYGPDRGGEEERREAYCAALAALLAALHSEAASVTVVLETQFVDTRQRGARGQARARAALGLALLRGSLAHTAHQAGAEVLHVSPQAAKRALVGHGRAEKRAMLQMARARLGLDLRLKDEHVADAAGLALAGQNWARVQAARQGVLLCL